MTRTVGDTRRAAGTRKQTGGAHDPHVDRSAPPVHVASHGSTSPERIRTIAVDDHEDVARLVAKRIAAIIRERSAAGTPTVLGLATGSTPIGVYRELIGMHEREGLSFAN